MTRETHEFSAPFGAEQIKVQIGKIAQQANGSCTVQVGGTQVLCATVANEDPIQGADFLPLMVDYREKFYSSGRIPGGFFKREGKPSDGETLTARLIDRPIRPLFPENYYNDTQVIVTVLSMDQENMPDIPSIISASVALCISDINFTTPVSAVRIAKVDGKLIVNPIASEVEKSVLNLIVAGTKDGITMVEAGAHGLTEAEILEALKLAQERIKELCIWQEEIVAKCGKTKYISLVDPIENALIEKVKAIAEPVFKDINKIFDKSERSKKLKELKKQIIAALAEEFPEREKNIGTVLENLYQTNVRNLILNDKIRPDGRAFTEVRHIWSEVSVLPRAHGSAIFTRGQTQSLAVATLGTTEDAQTIDNIMGESEKRFMLHYNFPAYSVGEVAPIRGPGRREIGHGALAERALTPAIPAKEDFPYTIRIVSEILESNGSSSMASVCAGCLSLMDAGVPIKAPVAGIAMGLIQEGDQFVVLSDIMGLEDHLGDMDFKVAGTKDGINALQMDIKIKSVSFDVLEKALAQAKDGRLHILGKMLETLAEPRPDLAPHAPRITVLQINPEKIREVIGPGGKVIRSIIDKTGVKIDIEDDGKIYIASVDKASTDAAIQCINEIVQEAELHKIYHGKVVRITDFGAFVEIFPNQDGLVHISELENYRVAKVEDVCRVGDKIMVKVIDIDKESGKVKLSRKQAMWELDPTTRPQPKPQAPRGEDRPRRDRE